MIAPPPDTRPDVVLIGGFAQLRPLVAAGLTPLVVPPAARADIRRSRHFRDSGLVLPQDLHRDGSAFLASLLRLSESLPSPPVLFYGDDAVLGFVARHRQPLLGAFRFEMPEAPLVEACLDKIRFARLGGERDLALPRQLPATPELDARAIERSIGFPCVLKPALREGWFESDAVRASGGKPRKVLRADGREQCAAALDAIRAFTDRFLVQEFIPGGEEQVYSFHAYVSRRPLPRVAYVGRKIRTYPSVGGESTLVQLVRDDAIMRLGWGTVDRLGLTGIMKIDVKRDVRTGRDYLLEVNLRSSLWTHLGARCGINLAQLAYRDQCGLTYQAVADYRTDVRWLHAPRDVQTCLTDYLRSGRLSVGEWIASYMHPKVYSVFAWDDPLPSVVHLLRKLGTGAARLMDRPRARRAAAGRLA